MQTNKKTTILTYSKNSALLKTINIALQSHFELTTVTTEDDLLEELNHFHRTTSIECVVIDIDTLSSLPQFVTDQLIEASAIVPVTILLTTPDISSILDLIRKGFYNIIEHPLSVNELVQGITATINNHLKMTIIAQHRATASIHFKQFRHDLINIITVATGYIELLLSDLSGTQHGVYCEKTEQSLQKLITMLKKGFVNFKSESAGNGTNVKK